MFVSGVRICRLARLRICTFKSKKHLSSAAVLTYLAECPVTKTIETGLVNTADVVSWVPAITGTALIYRSICFAWAVYAQKQNDRMVLGQNALFQLIHRKYKEKQDRLNMSASETATEVQQEFRKTKKQLYEMNNIHPARTLLLTTVSGPTWIFLGLALRNSFGDKESLLNSDLLDSVSSNPDVSSAVSIFGELTPYFAEFCPYALMVFLGLNMYYIAYKTMPNVFQMPVHTLRLFGRLKMSWYLAMLGIVSVYDMPTAVSYFWLLVASTGFLQNLVLSHNRTRAIFGLKPFPWMLGSFSAQAGMPQAKIVAEKKDVIRKYKL